MASIDSGVDTGNDSNDGFKEERTSSSQMEESEDNAKQIDPKEDDFGCSTASTTAIYIPSPLESTVNPMCRYFMVQEHSFPHEGLARYIRSDILEQNGPTPKEGDVITFQVDRPHSSLIDWRPYDPYRQATAGGSQDSSCVLYSARDSPSWSEQWHWQSSDLVRKSKQRCRPSLRIRRMKFYCNKWMEHQDKKCLRLAAFLNDVDKVRQLLQKGVDPDCQDCQSRTPLHLSACNGYTEVVRLLLKYSANPNKKDMVGNTPLHLAVCANHLEVVALLLNAGTDVNSKNRTGRSALELASSKLRVLRRNLLCNVNKNCQRTNEVLMPCVKMLQLLKSFLEKNSAGLGIDEELLTAFQTRLQVSDNYEKLEKLFDDVSSLSISPSPPSTSSTSSAS